MTMKIRTGIVSVCALTLLTACDRQPAPNRLPPPKAPAAASPLAARSGTAIAFETLVRLWIERTRRGSWGFFEQWAVAEGWQAVPDNYMSRLGSADGRAKGYMVERDEKWAVLAAVVTENDTATVVTVDDGDPVEAHRLLAEAMTLRRIGESKEVGQQTDMYVAMLGSERVGIVSITYGTHSLSRGTVSTGILHWKTAVTRVPKTEMVLRQMELEAKGR